MTPTEYGVLAFSSLFVIVDPLATVPAFLAMTARYTLSQRLRMARYRGILLACVALVGLASYAILALGASGAKWMSPLAEKIITRLMGLLLAALAVQFLFNGLKGEGGLYMR
jgi:small neutral amino acid transporter SnatA (MarC family)